ncbi:GRB2-associated and regulator of MAPK protein 1 isoform X2 [Megalops cyprinoides]|uniref:GRB2-associated and regulator of MAPK protein 1 isoform X2 n=1 Tax=Megalops cyprinoides TaxID=118141 RepID=UPI0018650772|nr:GRB2-associated and regulator of MAPK protein 1 isoform X2 [Megalops cyprinoides]
MDTGIILYNNLRDVAWSTTSLPLDRLVNVYRLPQIVKLDSGEPMDGLRDNDYLLIHSSRQWTTITAHSLEEGHYVIGPKIEIPVHYEGQFKLLEQDRDMKEPVQYFNSVEEVAKAFPERVYVMEDIIFNVKVASGECNEDTEVYNITLNTGDELTLMGQAEILYAKNAKEKSRLNTIFKKIGKLNSMGKLGHGKMPCLICMNHRTNESVSLPFQCKGRFSTRSPLELQMQEGEHTIRSIVEKTRLPVNVTVPSAPPRNQHDHHLIREGHRYKLVNIQTKTVVVCCVLRSNKIIPIHFPLHLAMPKFIIPEGLLQNELILDTIVHRWFSFCEEQFDIDDYSRAVRDVKSDWNEDAKSPKKTTNNGSSSSSCPVHNHVPSSLTYARDELTQSFHRLSVCVYGNNLHGNSEVNLQGYKSLCGDWGELPHDSVHSVSIDSDGLFPELAQDPGQSAGFKSDFHYEELWLDHGMHRLPREDTTSAMEKSKCDGNGGRTATLHYPATSMSGSIMISEICLPPPPVPPKSDAVKAECRLLNAPPVPPRSSRPTSNSVPNSAIKQHQQQQTRCPSPTLSYYSSGLHNMSPTFERISSRLSWPNEFCGGNSYGIDEFLSAQCRSYYSYPRQKTSGAQIGYSTTVFENEGRGKTFTSSKHCESFSIDPISTTKYGEMYRDNLLTEQSINQCLPPRVQNLDDEVSNVTLMTVDVDGIEEVTQKSSVDQKDNAVNSIELHLQLMPQLCSSPWQPPTNLSGLSVEEVSKSLRFIGLSEDIVSLFVIEKIDGNLLLQLTEEILSEDFKLSKLQVKKLMQFINGWRPKM